LTVSYEAKYIISCRPVSLLLYAYKILVVDLRNQHRLVFTIYNNTHHTHMTILTNNNINNNNNNNNYYFYIFVAFRFKQLES